MKRTALFLGAFALSFPVQLALPAPAEAEDSSWIVDFCETDVLPVDLETNLGECVAWVNTLFKSPDGFQAQRCDGLMEVNPEIFFALYDDYADCILDSRHD